MKTWKRCMITHEVQNIRPLNHSMFTTMLKKRENKRVSLDITIEHLLNITCYTPTCVSVMLSVLMPQADLESAVENMLELDDTVLVLVKHHYICLGKKWNAQTLAVTNVRKTVIADEDGSRVGHSSTDCPGAQGEAGVSCIFGCEKDSQTPGCHCLCDSNYQSGWTRHVHMCPIILCRLWFANIF